MVIKMRRNDLEELEQKIGYHFQDRALLLEATTHSSFSNEQKINKAKNYERLEFLGDAVLELTASDFLFAINPPMQEGKMTKTRAMLVCEQALAECARELELGNYLRLGKGEEGTGGRKRESITADVVEAIIGAIYIDSGLEEAKRFIQRFILSDLERKQLFHDSKTLLQEMVQKNGIGQISYVLLEERGPEHDKSFLMEARLDDKKIGEGAGRTKKSAEQQAAYQALLSLKKEKVCI